MEKKIHLLDCTLRDGSYIVEADFGTPVIRGITKRLENANIDIIECGWLKDAPHRPGTAFYHVPADAIAYMPEQRSPESRYAVMIDWNRYDLDRLPEYVPGAPEIIRLVFPHEHAAEAIPLGRKIKEKGYSLFYQAANTLGYSDAELVELAAAINREAPESISIVDTFGAMYPEDLERIFGIMDRELAPGIKLGFHSHNNQQLSFAMSMEFVKLAAKSSRRIVVDSSLCGMGRGAGNTTTELLTNYINRFHHGNYELNEIMDTIDLYLSYLGENYQWGYSIPFFIAGIYCTHVNNIDYLLKHHRTLARDMRIIIESIDPAKRRAYDYDNLEKIYVDYQNRIVDDSRALSELREKFGGREVLLLGPGRTLTTCRETIEEYRKDRAVLTVGVNAVPTEIRCDAYFFSTPARYLYAHEVRGDIMQTLPVILTSNIKREAEKGEFIVNFNLLCKLGWKFFDNACIMALRLMAKLRAAKIAFAGFDGFPEDDTKSFYADKIAQPVVPLEKRIQINADICDMLRDFIESDHDRTAITFITPSRFSSFETSERGAGT